MSCTMFTTATSFVDKTSSIFCYNVIYVSIVSHKAGCLELDAVCELVTVCFFLLIVCRWHLN